MDKPELKLSVFSDYICPFSYIGHHRLQQLKNDYDLKINWCLIEIHPETPASGMPTTELDYSSEQWQGLVNSLNDLLDDEQLPFKHEHNFTTNSHQALLLAEACKPLGADIFYRVHNRLFEAFFVDMINIGDANELKKIADDCDVPDEITAQALSSNSKLEEHLKLYLQYAQQAQISGVPSTIIGQKKLTGVSSIQSLKKAAEESLTDAVS